MNIILNPNDLAKLKVDLLMQILAGQKAANSVLFELLSNDDDHLNEIDAKYRRNCNSELATLRSQLIADYGDLSSLF